MNNFLPKTDSQASYSEHESDSIVQFPPKSNPHFSSSGPAKFKNKLKRASAQSSIEEAPCNAQLMQAETNAMLPPAN